MSIRVYPLASDDLTSMVPWLAIRHVTAYPEHKNCRRTRTKSWSRRPGIYREQITICWLRWMVHFVGPSLISRIHVRSNVVLASYFFKFTAPWRPVFASLQYVNLALWQAVQASQARKKEMRRLVVFFSQGLAVFLQPAGAEGIIRGAQRRKKKYIRRQ